MSKEKAEKKEDKESLEREDKPTTNRWLPLVAALVIIGAGIIVAFLLGLRITYAPELENSWDAISAVASWASVAASFFAVWAAIQIPKKIAKKQDAISLFEKRFDCYTTIQNLLVCAEQMKKVETNKDVNLAFRIYFGQPEDIMKTESGAVLAIQLKQKQVAIVSGTFLFSEYSVEMLRKIINTGVSLIMNAAIKEVTDPDLPLSDKTAKLKEEYCQLCKEYKEKYLEPMEKELNLK